jgi:hypothetical protein
MPTMQELWTVSSVHRSETIKLKKLASGKSREPKFCEPALDSCERAEELCEPAFKTCEPAL